MRFHSYWGGFVVKRMLLGTIAKKHKIEEILSREAGVCCLVTQMPWTWYNDNLS
jgi:hypothetical protein